ncbi:MAG: flagellar hook-associated protein 1 [Chthoniobacter sp.]|jgi:flagellar hook-associated protein 1 FlgK|nr:flagellar hook-associated protein 1 [Chthoniobacter sp.]
MSSLIANLLRGTAGLTAQSKGLEVTGRNLANVNTPGYARQRVDLNSGATMQGTNGPEPMGVRIAGVSQLRDTFLDRQVQAEKSLSSGLALKQDIYDQVQTALGQNINTAGQSAGVEGISSSTGGISGGLDEFFGAFQELGANPADAATKSTVLESAGALVDQINLADQRLATVQSDLTEKIGSDVTSVNQLLHDVAGLNEKIARFESGSPGGALDLRDQRQAKLEALSGYMNFETRPNPSGNGQIQVFSRDDSGNEVTLVDRNAVVAPVSSNGSAFEAGSPPSALALTSGALTTELQARDGFTQSVRNDLASVATQLRTAVNTAYNPGGTGQDFFAAGAGGRLLAIAPGLTGATLQASATGDAGANEIANAVAAVADQRFSTSGGAQINGTLGGFFGATVAGVGDALKSAGSALEDQQLTEQLAVSRRDQVSGVSLDEETTNLMKYQRAFQASARFVNVIDQMLDVVVNQMGRS